MNLVDKLLAIDAKVITEKATAEVEIKRLSELTGEPFIVKIQALDGDKYQELQARLLDKKGNVDYAKVYNTNALLLVAGVTEPNLGDEKLQRHFGAGSPKDLAIKLFQGGELTKLSDAIVKVSGFTEEDEEDEEKEIKN